MNAQPRIVHTDCAHYRGDMPCEPHKRKGRVCDGCPDYDRLVQRVLIVKLGAMGDVLRTAALLPDITAAHVRPHVTWLTRPESVALVRGNPLVHRVIARDSAAGLSGATFDAVYALDSDPESLAFAALPDTENYRGFVRGEFGTCVGVAPGGDPALFEIGLWDDLKRANRRKYLDLLAATASVNYTGGKPWIPQSELEFAQAADDLSHLPRPIVGINADAGGRWERKHWNAEYIEDLAERLVRDGCGIVLFGVGRVFERNTMLASRWPGRVAAFESSAGVPRFIAGIAQCRILLTGDTLGMHIAWGLNVPIVALFGPTSRAEIELGTGSRQLAATELECLGCYLKTCSVDPHCMDRLTPEIVYGQMRELLTACE